jgi:cell division protein FtsB
MKSLIYKILGIFGVLFAFFQIGKRNGKNTLKNEINKNRLEDVKRTNKLEEEIRNLDNDSARAKLQKYARK